MNNLKIFSFIEKCKLFAMLKFKIRTKHSDEILNLKNVLNSIEKNGWFIFSEANKKWINIQNINEKLNFIIRKYSSDAIIFSHIFIYLSYKSFIDLIISKLDSSKSIIVIDAGANIGLFSVYLSIFFKKNKIIAIEPDISNAEVLEKNFIFNQIQNSLILKGALWINNEPLEISRDFRDKKDWSITVKPSDKIDAIHSYTFYDIFEKYKLEVIDILKIDIEGTEKKIFEKEEYSNFFLQKTKFIAIEIHDEFNCREMIYESLKKNNFDFFEDGELTIGYNKNLVL